MKKRNLIQVYESIGLEDKSYGCAQCVVPASGSWHVLPLLGPQVPTGHLLFLLLLVCLSFIPQSFLCLPFPPPEMGCSFCVFVRRSQLT